MPHSNPKEKAVRIFRTKKIGLVFWVALLAWMPASLAGVGSPWLQTENFFGSSPLIQEKVQSILEKYYKTLASGDCVALYTAIYDPAHKISEEELCRFIKTPFFSFIRQYHLKPLKISGYTLKQDEIYFVKYYLEEYKQHLLTSAQAKLGSAELPQVLKIFLKNHPDAKAILNQQKLSLRQFMSIDVRTEKVGSTFVSQGYEEIMESLDTLKALNEELDHYNSSQNKDLKTDKEKWDRVLTLIQETQERIFTADWDMVGTPLYLAVQLDRQIKKLKELSEFKKTNMNSVRYCYELARL